jgi:hypothetical protein
MTISSVSSNADGVTVQVRRKDGSIYTVELLPKDDEVLLHFSGTSDATLQPVKETANQVSVKIKRR